MPKKKKKDGKPQVHEDLKGLEVNINPFGEIITNISADDLNEFLNKHTDDKKLREKEPDMPAEEEEQEPQSFEDLEDLDDLNIEKNESPD